MDNSDLPEITEGSYYTDAVRWAVKNNIIELSDGCFSPDAAVSRGETAILIWNMEGLPSAPMHSFVDVTDDGQHAAVSWMSHANITTGTSPTTFSPDETLIRAHTATFLQSAGRYAFGTPPFVRRRVHRLATRWSVVDVSYQYHDWYHSYHVLTRQDVDSCPHRHFPVPLQRRTRDNRHQRPDMHALNYVSASRSSHGNAVQCLTLTIPSAVEYSPAETEGSPK